MNADFSDLPTRIATVVEKETGVFAVAVKDPRTGFHWSQNAFPMRSASLIKLFIMVEAFEQMKTAQLLSDTVLSFTESDRVAGSGLLQELPARPALYWNWWNS